MRRFRNWLIAIFAALAIFVGIGSANADAGEQPATVTLVTQYTNADGSIYSEYDRTEDGVTDISVTTLNGCAIDALDHATGTPYVEFWGCPSAEYLAINLGIAANAGGGGTAEAPALPEANLYAEQVAPAETYQNTPVEPATTYEAPITETPTTTDPNAGLSYGQYGYTYTDEELAEIRTVEPNHPATEQNGWGGPTLLHQGQNRGMDWTGWDRDGNGSPDVSVYSQGGCAVEVHDVKGSSDANPDPSAMTQPGGCLSPTEAAGSATYTK